MAQANVLLHIRLGSHISTFPKFNTTSLYVNSLRKCHLSYPIIQAIKTSNFVVQADSSSSKIPYWSSINTEIEGHLTRAMRIREPLNVYEPMHHLAFDGPRSMAPALCVAACELVGGHRTQALQVASALHVMHAAFRAHDYLNLTDRPRPKTRCEPIDHVFSSSIELQTGDGLLSFGYELLARLNHSCEDSGRVLRVIIEVSRAMGGQGVVEGRFREVECCQVEGEEVCQEGWLRHMYEKKSGCLYACGAACGAIIGGASDEEIEIMKKFGLYIGTIQGLLDGYANNKNIEINETIQSLRELGLKELENFDPEKIGTISSFVNVSDV